MVHNRSGARQGSTAVDRVWTVDWSQPGWGVLPYLLSMLGVLLDYLTTAIGLGIGFYESHPAFTPLVAVAFFWGTLGLFHLMLPRGKVRALSTRTFVFVSFVGAINNTLVITGIL